MGGAQLKHPARYWLVRAYAATALPLWWVTIAIGLYRSVMLGQNDTRLFVLVLAMTPFAVLAILAMFSWHAFPFAYSVFGRYRRTEFPKEGVLCEITWSHVVIGRCFRSNLGIIWFVFPSGVGILVWGIGRVFLPFAEIGEVTKVGRSRYRIDHSCAEVRSPIVMPGRVMDAILDVFRGRNDSPVRMP